MNDDLSVFEKILNKDLMVAKMQESGMTQEQIVVEWDRLVQVFSFLYLQSAYDMLSEEVQSEIIEGMSEDPSQEEIKQFCQKMTSYLDENPDSVDKAAAVQTAMNGIAGAYGEFSQREEK